jgi:hypothetical protein
MRFPLKKMDGISLHIFKEICTYFSIFQSIVI